jgi:hypothetical protein
MRKRKPVKLTWPADMRRKPTPLEATIKRFSRASAASETFLSRLYVRSERTIAYGW